MRVAGEDTKPPRGQPGKYGSSFDKINVVRLAVFHLDAGIESAVHFSVCCVTLEILAAASFIENFGSADAFVPQKTK